VIRLVVADDQSLVRMGLRVLIRREADLELVGEAADGRAAIELIRRTRPDVALLDVRMPGLDGLAALRAVTAEPALSGTRVVMLTTFETDEYVFAALTAGASGFLLKDAEPAELIGALRAVAGGGAQLSPSVTRRVIKRFERPPAGEVPALDPLTEREREIVGWVATGRSNDEIAAELFLSSATVRTHVGRAMRKLRARDRAQLVVLAWHAGLGRW
jgi:DNA-binding NarL/FixJ family response regulator